MKLRVCFIHQLRREEQASSILVQGGQPNELQPPHYIIRILFFGDAIITPWTNKQTS